MTIIDRQPAAGGRPSSTALAAWSAVAAFTAYFCTYGFRKPFTAATFSGGRVLGIDEKTVLVAAQVLGYAASKFVGIRVIAETPPRRRTAGIVLLIAAAEAALVLFGVAPSPLHVAGLFLNGLALGMVFGLVLGFLEGRRVTEALTAGLCASFILADGVTKSVGTLLLDRGVTERWMPAAAGLIFLPPLLVATWMLGRHPPARRPRRRPPERPPDDEQGRPPGHAATPRRRPDRDRRGLLPGHDRPEPPGRFRAEIWRGLGIAVDPALFSRSEVLVAAVVLLVNGLGVLIVENRRAFFASIGVGIAGAMLMLIALAGLGSGRLGGFAFMVLLGTGLYLPYVAIHTTIFERLIAIVRDRGNLGFLMYVADSAGYFGYVLLMLARGALPSGGGFLRFFEVACAIIGVLTCVSLGLGGLYFARRGIRAVPAGAVR